MPLHPHLQAALDAIDSTTAGMSEAELAEHRRPGKWSAAEILEHLSLGYSGTTYGMSKVLEKGRPLGRRPGLKACVGILMAVGVGYFPKIEAPESTRPRGLRPLEALNAVRVQLLLMEEALNRVEARFGPRVLVANHPLLEGFSVARWRRFHWQHTRHHTKQIRAMRAMVVDGQ